MSFPPTARAIRALSALIGAVVLSVRPSDAAQIQSRRVYVPFDSLLRVGAPRLTIGSANTEGPALFARIRSVAMDKAGNVYVLDAGSQAVRSFSQTGRHIGTGGRSGRGPGDFTDPVMIAHDGMSLLYVADSYAGVSIFDTEDGKITYRTRFAAELRPTAICLLRGDLIVAAFHNNRVLHVFGKDGSFKRSMGDYFHTTGSEGLKAISNTGELAVGCDESTGIAMVAQRAGNVLIAYDLNGRVAWRDTLPEFLGSKVLEDRKRPGSFITVFGKFEIETILSVTPNLLVVQAHHQDRKRARSPSGTPTTTAIDHGIVTYVLAKESGRVLSRAYGLPFLGSTGNGVTVAYDDDPFPRAFVMGVRARRP